MNISQLILTDFRSYREAALNLAPGVNVFHGKNGAGKTNLLEAVGFLATLKSHRVASDEPLIRIGADKAIIQARIQKQSLTANIELEILRHQPNRTRINQGKPEPARNVLGILQSTTFAPEDLGLVRGDPQNRRRFIDSQILQLIPQSGVLYAEYERVLKQRAALLKDIKTNGVTSKFNDQLSLWNEKLVAAGAQITNYRLAYLAELMTPLNESYRSIDQSSGEVNLSYETKTGNEFQFGSLGSADSIPDNAAIIEQFTKALPGIERQEIARGANLAGPHVDDVMIGLNQMPAKTHASHGEAWSVALALRLASLQVLRNVSQREAGSVFWAPLVEPDSHPLLILDDVFAELDEGRRNRLADHLESGNQILISSATSDAVPKQFFGRMFQVEDGSITQHGD